MLVLPLSQFLSPLIWITLFLLLLWLGGQQRASFLLTVLLLLLVIAALKIGTCDVAPPSSTPPAPFFPQTAEALLLSPLLSLFIFLLLRHVLSAMENRRFLFSLLPFYYHTQDDVFFSFCADLLPIFSCLIYFLPDSDSVFLFVHFSLLCSPLLCVFFSVFWSIRPHVFIPLACDSL